MEYAQHMEERAAPAAKEFTICRCVSGGGLSRCLCRVRDLKNVYVAQVRGTPEKYGTPS